MGDINIIKKPITQLTVEFNGKMWEVLEMNKKENMIKLKCLVGDKKEIIRNLNNNITFCSY